MSTPQRAVSLRGKTIHEDEFGRWNLNDIWELANARESQLPKEWVRKPTTKRLIDALQKKVVISHLKEDKLNIPVLYAKQGRGNSGTFAHPVLAAAYAGYLSPKLEIETREVWLRFRAGDATLADEILQNASPAANEWVAKRALGRSARASYTQTLSNRGVTEPRSFATCTNTTYKGLFDKTAKQIRTERAIKGATRDAFDLKELVFVAASEVLSVERMEDENSQGFRECNEATGKAAKAIRSAIEADRKDRQPRSA